ncbi:MAG: hypothetical protein WC819_04310 [Parcubacteria group bacterium]|jgi:hypothetical protein
MNDAQIFQIFGIGLFLIGLAWVIDGKAYKQTLRDILNNRGVLLLMGLFALITGYLIVALYDTDSIIVTILGWVALVKGLFIIVIPSLGKSLYAALENIKKYLIIMPWIVLAMGAALIYAGYFA